MKKKTNSEKLVGAIGLETSPVAGYIGGESTTNAPQCLCFLPEWPREWTQKPIPCHIERQAQVTDPVRVQRVAAASGFMGVVAGLHAFLLTVQRLEGRVDIHYPWGGPLSNTGLKIKSSVLNRARISFFLYLKVHQIPSRCQSACLCSL